MRPMPPPNKDRGRIPGDIRVWFTIIAGLIVMMVSMWVAMRLLGLN